MPDASRYRVDTLDMSQLEPGDVIITARRWADLGGVFIRMGNFFKRGFTERVWSHATVYAGNGKVIEALPTGIAENDLEKKYLQGEHSIRVLRHKNASEEQRRQAVEFCRKEIGQKYENEQQLYFVLNYLVAPSLRFALENNFFDRLFPDKGAYFCSELAAASYLHAGAYPFERKPRKIMPLDFYNPLIFDLVAECIMWTEEDTLMGRMQSILSYFLYLVAALVFFAVDAALAVVFFLFGHLVLIGFAITSAAAALVDVVTVWFRRRKGG